MAAPWIETPVEEHDPALYQPASKAEVLPGPDSVDDNAVAFYREHGYLAVADVFDADQVRESLDNLERLRQGAVEGVYAQKEAAADGEADTIDSVRKLFFDAEAVPRSGMAVDHPNILNIARLLMGGQDPVIFQTMALLKPPRIGREKPWHQDHAYFDVDLQDRIVGVWIALDHATLENGCMQVIDGGHLEGPKDHWKRRDWQICDTDMLGRRSTAAELKPGAALFFDSLLPHGTPINRSDKQRRALQFHYAPANARSWSPEQRLAIFGTEGKDVTC